MLNQNIDVYADVIKAFAEGKKIQWMNVHDKDFTWYDWNETNDIPAYNLAYRYRVRPDMMYIRLYRDRNCMIQTFVSQCKDDVKSCSFGFGDWCSDPIEVKLY